MKTAGLKASAVSLALSLHPGAGNAWKSSAAAQGLSTSRGRDGTEGSRSRVVHPRVPDGADLTWVPRSVHLHRDLFVFTEEKLPAGRAGHEEPQAGRLPGLQFPCLLS